MSKDNELIKNEWAVVCVDCLNPQNNETVMRSPWYQQGMTPPCHFCGGVTREVPVKDMDIFIENARKGKPMV